MEQLAQDRVLLELGKAIDELGERGGVVDDKSDRVVRRAVVAGVVLSELGGAVRKLTLGENRVPARGFALVERGLGLGREEAVLA